MKIQSLYAHPDVDGKLDTKASKAWDHKFKEAQNGMSRHELYGAFTFMCRSSPKLFPTVFGAHINVVVTLQNCLVDEETFPPSFRFSIGLSLEFDSRMTWSDLPLKCACVNKTTNKCHRTLQAVGR